jgi:biopolymer transport protein ExbB/TolQ
LSSSSIAALATAIAGLIAAISTLVAIILTHGKVTQVRDIVSNGGDTHDGTTKPNGPTVPGNG